MIIKLSDDAHSGVVHYGGEPDTPGVPRHGWLYFYHNTLVSQRAGTTLLQLETAAESADVRNNILFVSGSGNSLAFLDNEGSVVARNNWLKQGWIKGHGPTTAVDVQGSQVGLTQPGFVDSAGGNYRIV